MDRTYLWRLVLESGKREGWVGDVSISPLLKAFQKFEQFRPHNQTEQERAGIIQAFEYTFELCWKTMKRLLDERGQIVNSPRETLRMAAMEGLIQDPEVWFDFLRKRNLASHSYNEKEAEVVISITNVFSLEVKAFLKTIGYEVPHDQS